MSELIAQLSEEAIELLTQLIQTQSFSREETATADILEAFLTQHTIPAQRQGHNVWATSRHFDPAKPTILLNSHHDTVRPGVAWSYPPFGAVREGDKLIGLGSNDAGASAVSLLAVFRYFYDQPTAFNLICAITAEEEISGANGIKSILPELGKIDLGIVGEPTSMNAAIAEKGLLVLDGVAHGRTGHAARNEGDNALYKALDDINWLRSYQFPKVSELLGPVKMTVTQISAGTQHNVVPDECRYVVDVRPTECYTNEEILEIIRANVQAEITPRSTHLQSSGISLNHPIVRKAVAMGKTTYGSPTLSDQALMRFPTLKMGPGDSARSHAPDEYILLSEIRGGIADYIGLLSDFKF
ncbi:M20/M25/M40 family metallo-hydrolase [Hymenobacter sp. UV11]|uniref:M20 family metallo-hydrolase n=1 Tax=Hymenobacter sp. UV11 TaxID=1849735 RepID=UPI00105CE56B|nr:M20 family metallo-hydrolase [Hymenobacter sp. UV11]TDN38221.1 acetylornithine deacetylase [Hymenobacter sp. UV11]TFZ67603.1 M20/M25/M40 family metallo-hydrolase [Hymenobacter sp. UV11]